MRPNSVAHTTSVSSSRPRCFRSLSRPAIGLSTCAQFFAWLCLQVAVRVPAAGAAVAAVIDLHEPHAALDQPPRRQAIAGRTAVVSLSRPYSFCVAAVSSLKLEHLGHRRLHAERQLVRLDARPHRCVVRILDAEQAGSAGRAARTRACCSSRNTPSAGWPKGSGLFGSSESGTPSCSGPR